MNAKTIADKHFSKHYNYYRSICFKTYRGRYLYEDLLTEAYLRFTSLSPDVILKFHNERRPEKHIEDRFKKIIKLIILDLYRSRKIAANRITNGAVNGSSPLFETPNINYNYDLIACEEIGINESQLQNDFTKAVSAINKALQEPVKKTKVKSNWLKVKVFVEVQKDSINKISQTTGISRPFITQTYREAQEFLQKEIAK